jgi:Uma2 family endonuclease
LHNSGFWVTFVKKIIMRNVTRREHWTLESLARQYGPIELQRPLSKEEFVMIANYNPDLRMERESDGIVTLMSPVKIGSSLRENHLSFLLNLWNHQMGEGQVFGPNGTYDLPDGAIKMPDISWISSQRFEKQPEGEDSYIQVVPDFVAEIRSSTDRLPKLLKKMTDTWMANGVRLAWLIDPYQEKVYVYRTGQPMETLSGFIDKKLSGEDVLLGFELPLDKMRATK